MKKTVRFIGVLFVIVVGLTVYNRVNEIATVSQPQPAVSNPEPTVSSAPDDGSVIVRDKGASFVMAPISKQ